ncbi:hypothetical protein ADL22_12615 [Streptomyces sp. NRRL F-4489]|uniref:hypothetical protein n=1 Tax=Streptomyces sp. NRRL F-4489 TaxID=1609095 RepID=UPI00074AECCA|nr:hypothetical protein [Streptomyces sp. NRRL F-4489]KUL44779.1 hypothetical protein ADL22_12615 [Streptomyces sp. NRRL F-4489]
MSGEQLPLFIDGVSAEEFLAELFEFELCAECGGEHDQHTAAPDMFGKWHAWCQGVETVGAEPPKDSPLCGWQTEYGTVNGPKFCAVDKEAGSDWCEQHRRLIDEAEDDEFKVGRT